MTRAKRRKKYKEKMWAILDTSGTYHIEIEPWWTLQDAQAECEKSKRMVTGKFKVVRVEVVEI